MGNASRILVAQMARLWLSPVGTVAPTTPIAAMGTGWVDVGYFDPASLEMADAPTFQAVAAHQSAYPVRRWQDTDSASFNLQMLEWSQTALTAVYGGGTFTTVTGPPAYYKYQPPGVGTRTQTAACIEVIDGAKHYRTIIPLCWNEGGITIPFHRNAPSGLQTTFQIIGSDVADPWYLVTDDVAMSAP